MTNNIIFIIKLNIHNYTIKKYFGINVLGMIGRVVVPPVD
jgi:hypothetical protein